jgi:hypothetical protein
VTTPNLIRERLRTLAILDLKDGMQSLELWRDKLIAKGYKVYFEQICCQAVGESHYIFAFVSLWQQQVRAYFSLLLCTDL